MKRRCILSLIALLYVGAATSEELALFGESGLGYSNNINLEHDSDLAEEAGVLRTKLSLIGKRESPTYLIDSDLSVLNTRYIETDRSDSSDITGTLNGEYEYIPGAVKSSLNFVAEKPLPFSNFDDISSDDSININIETSLESTLQFGRGNAARTRISYSYLDEPSSNPSNEERLSITNILERRSTPRTSFSLVTSYSKPTNVTGSDVYSELTYGANFEGNIGRLVSTIEIGQEKIDQKYESTDFENRYFSAGVNYSNESDSGFSLNFERDSSNRSQVTNITEDVGRELAQIGEVDAGASLAQTTNYEFELYTTWQLTTGGILFSRETVDFLSSERDEESDSVRLRLSQSLSPRLELAANASYSEISYVTENLGRNKDFNLELSLVHRLNEDVSIRYRLGHLSRSNRVFSVYDYEELSSLVSVNLKLY